MTSHRTLSEHWIELGVAVAPLLPLARHRHRHRVWQGEAEVHVLAAAGRQPPAAGLLVQHGTGRAP